MKSLAKQLQKYTKNMFFYKKQKYAFCVQSQNQFSQKLEKSVDKSEMSHFQNVNDWWNPTGEMRALWEYNITRIRFMKEINSSLNLHQILKLQEPSKPEYVPLEGLKILDVGCGGGLLAESLARLGGNVTGIDACENSIQIAKGHQQLDSSKLQNLNYKLITVEQLLEEQGENQYDMITSMEVLEHVQDKQIFLSSISKLLKPQGILFLSTMAKSCQSYLELIVAAEYVLNIVKKGTHDWNKFVNAKDLSSLLQKNSINEIQLQGVNYDFLNNQMQYSSSLNTTYMYAGQKREE